MPELTGPDVKALLAPLISFDVKTPVQAFTDTLPAKLKDAILGHQVLVGMSTDMVLFAKGAPDTKSREMEGQMPFEEWIYGKPPKDVEFVRINGNRVIRVEVAKIGEKPVVFTEDVVTGMMRTDGTPLEPDATRTRGQGGRRAARSGQGSSGGAAELAEAGRDASCGRRQGIAGGSDEARSVPQAEAGCAAGSESGWAAGGCAASRRAVRKLRRPVLRRSLPIPRSRHR